MMADETRAKLLDLIKDQGEVVRKLKAAKADGAKGLPDLIDLNSELADLNGELADASYVCDWHPTSKDVELFNVCRNYSHDKVKNLPHLKRWLDNIKSYSDSERLAFPSPKTIASSLIEKVNRLANPSGNVDLKNIDKKVRQLLHASRAATDLFTNTA